MLRLVQPDQRIAAQRDLLEMVRFGQDRYLRLLRVVAVEGPPNVFAGAELVGESIAAIRRDIEKIVEGHLEAAEQFEVHFDEGATRLLDLIDEVRTALDGM
ncbi:hypothetical protein GCM10009837_23300 [Streptomyces durmitorensis]